MPPVAARDSLHARDRAYFLRLVQIVVQSLRIAPERRLELVERIRELVLMAPSRIESSLIVGDTVFYQICTTLQPLFLLAIDSLLEHEDPTIGYRVADELEAAVPLEVRLPGSQPESW
ncbi:uncharacterized protein N7500_008577 [Penicillium coprophilum]|uniref:uncharacterized protein n=1 Tax=Penicillium coprophilum TaxID=36646 RepID=UPI0023A5F47A|nr:uncharacterized protein N7500_008577 [Penicillium coprophilum]KAJ5158926.1 hypothetical protein N7500_008577 [Penicillium coprophilum]